MVSSTSKGDAIVLGRTSVSQDLERKVPVCVFLKEQGHGTDIVISLGVGLVDSFSCVRLRKSTTDVPRLTCGLSISYFVASFLKILVNIVNCDNV